MPATFSSGGEHFYKLPTLIGMATLAIEKTGDDTGL
jgi:hypothetical protein